MQKAAIRRQEVAMAIQLEEQRKAYEEIRRKMELMQSAQSESDSGLGRVTGETGYELMALKTPALPDTDPAYPDTGPAYMESPAYPEFSAKNAVVDEMEKEEREKAKDDGYDKLVERPQEEGEPLDTIAEEGEEEGPTSPAPYLVGRIVCVCCNFVPLWVHHH